MYAPWAEEPILFEVHDLWVRPVTIAPGQQWHGQILVAAPVLGRSAAGRNAHGLALSSGGARIAYYDQSLHQLADDATLPDALYKFAPVGDKERRQALISAGFAYVRHGQTVATLSGGERLSAISRAVHGQLPPIVAGRTDQSPGYGRQARTCCRAGGVRWRFSSWFRTTAN